MRLPTRKQAVIRLVACRACERFVKPSDARCPFCGADVAEAFNARAKQKAELDAAIAAVEAILGAPKKKRPRRS